MAEGFWFSICDVEGAWLGVVVQTEGGNAANSWAAVGDWVRLMYVHTVYIDICSAGHWLSFCIRVIKCMFKFGWRAWSNKRFMPTWTLETDYIVAAVWFSPNEIYNCMRKNKTPESLRSKTSMSIMKMMRCPRIGDIGDDEHHSTMVCVSAIDR